MKEGYITDKCFDHCETLSKGEYESCTFNHCNFAEMDFSGFKFIDCTFNVCNLSLAKLEKTSFSHVHFQECKMLALRFDSCNAFGLALSFDGCQLNLTSFFKLHMRKTSFKNSQLQETDFTEADVTGSLFENCNMKQAIFDQTNLEKSDLRTSYNYCIDPENNRLKKAKFSMQGVIGLLDKYDIEIEHT